MIAFDWLVAEPCGGTHRHCGNEAPSSWWLLEAKPRCWKTPKLYTVGGDEHGKYWAAAATAFTFSTVQILVTIKIEEIRKKPWPQICFSSMWAIYSLSNDATTYYFIEAKHCFSATNRRYSQGLIVSATKWPIHIVSVVGNMSAVLYNLSVFLYLHSPQLCFWSDKRNQGFKPMCVCVFCAIVFALGYGSMVTFLPPFDCFHHYICSSLLAISMYDTQHLNQQSFNEHKLTDNSNSKMCGISYSRIVKVLFEQFDPLSPTFFLHS